MHNLPLRAAAIAATVVAFSAHLALAQEDSSDVSKKPLHRTISVTGTGKVSAAPDVCDINVGVVTQAATARDALAANSEAMTAVHNLLKERGVADKDIQTISINVQPRYSQQPRQPQPGDSEGFVPKIVGYDVTNMVHITARDLKKLGAILDAVVQSGANQINGICFRIEEPQKLLDVARKQAMQDAHRKAEQLAGEAGVVVGLPISIDEGGSGPPMPKFFGRADMGMAAPMSAAPVAGGELELNISVSVTYELRAAK